MLRRCVTRSGRQTMEETSGMADLAYLALTVGVFGLLMLVVRGLERL
ncbi:hypothetical protein UA75_26160 [Actinoalloteichus sp. GBA129-24]|uniref:Potassium-transporting ATPase n=1 Tax=Actinoalloteichus fjordicus TaxID=1612552 RepID=A0AAC9PUF1_9PSEU|nr:hypothetical protein UA74_25580 [Actinoalloteichus fjordicus]APU23205.1 hypothetical protein UA75_26160 [Actinoalloteichus sp. GBA129-24]